MVFSCRSVISLWRVCFWMQSHHHAKVYMWRWEPSTVELVYSVYFWMGSADWAHVSGLLQQVTLPIKPSFWPLNDYIEISSRSMVLIFLILDLRDSFYSKTIWRTCTYISLLPFNLSFSPGLDSEYPIHWIHVLRVGPKLLRNIALLKDVSVCLKKY